MVDLKEFSAISWQFKGKNWYRRLISLTRWRHSRPWKATEGKRTGWKCCWPRLDPVCGNHGLENCQVVIKSSDVSLDVVQPGVYRLHTLLPKESKANFPFLHEWNYMIFKDVHFWWDRLLREVFSEVFQVCSYSIFYQEKNIMCKNMAY